MDIHENIAKGFKTLRKELGLNQVQLAKSLGVVSGFISGIENGQKLPRLELLLKLQQLYNINVNFFITGNGNLFYREDGIIDLESKRGLLGDQMIENFKDLFWYLENSDIVRLDVISHFKEFLYRNRDRLEVKRNNDE